MGRYTRSASRAEARRRLFGSTHCWKCDMPPKAQHNGVPYCSQPHHPDPVQRPSDAACPVCHQLQSSPSCERREHWGV